MKKILSIICIIFVLFITLLIVEYVRFSLLKREIPLIVIDKKFCSKDSFACYDEDGIYTEKYYGVGFATEVQYALIDNKNIEIDYKYYIKERHFILFYIFTL